VTGGARLGIGETPLPDSLHVCQVSFSASIMLVWGLLEELETAKGSIVKRQLHRRRPAACFRGGRLIHLQRRTCRAYARDGA
jgi:hypothetical protein